jgi:Zn finger protein HypA/HybF involved in hydrogenase expression
MKEITNPDYWDCECPENYIHKKSDTLTCPKCGAIEEDNPDSMTDEVEAMLKGIPWK